MCTYNSTLSSEAKEKYFGSLRGGHTSTKNQSPEIKTFGCDILSGYTPELNGLFSILKPCFAKNPSTCNQKHQDLHTLLYRHCILTNIIQVRMHYVKLLIDFSSDYKLWLHDVLLQRVYSRLTITRFARLNVLSS